MSGSPHGLPKKAVRIHFSEATLVRGVRLHAVRNRRLANKGLESLRESISRALSRALIFIRRLPGLTPVTPAAARAATIGATSSPYSRLREFRRLLKRGHAHLYIFDLNGLLGVIQHAVGGTHARQH